VARNVVQETLALAARHGHAIDRAAAFVPLPRLEPQSRPVCEQNRAALDPRRGDGEFNAEELAGDKNGITLRRSHERLLERRAGRYPVEYNFLQYQAVRLPQHAIAQPFPEDIFVP